METITEFEMVTKDRELVTRYVTDIDNTVDSTANGVRGVSPTFETDANGMLMMERVINRTGYNNTADEKYYHVTMAVAGNYYPLASPGTIRIMEQGQGLPSKQPAPPQHAQARAQAEPEAQAPPRMLTVLTDRAHGASSLRRGWVEVMLGTWRSGNIHRASAVFVDSVRSSTRTLLRPMSRPCRWADETELTAALSLLNGAS